jgi:copper chaperone NosL
MKTPALLLSFLVLFLASCTVEPEPIQYGKDECHFCKMGIVDAQHGAELVNTHGKCFKFDAIECMVQFLHANPTKEFGMFLVNDYSNPGALIDAQVAHFLVSKEIPSPMGADLSAFANEADAKSTHESHGGKLYDWQGISEYLE